MGLHQRNGDSRCVLDERAFRKLQLGSDGYDADTNFAGKLVTAHRAAHIERHGKETVDIDQRTRLILVFAAFWRNGRVRNLPKETPFDFNTHAHAALPAVISLAFPLGIR